jgi:hypothetical protein
MHATWVAMHATWVAMHAAWVAMHATWVAMHVEEVVLISGSENGSHYRSCFGLMASFVTKMQTYHSQISCGL